MRLLSLLLLLALCAPALAAPLPCQGSVSETKALLRDLPNSSDPQGLLKGCVQRLPQESNTGLRRQILRSIRDSAEPPLAQSALLAVAGSDPNPGLRRFAAWALVARDLREAGGELAALAGKEAEEAVRITLLKSADDLWGGRHPEVVRLLRLDPSPQVRALCARILGRNPDPWDDAMRQALIGALADEEETVAMDAARALGERGFRDVVPDLEACPEGKRKEVCQEIAALLKKEGKEFTPPAGANPPESSRPEPLSPDPAPPEKD